MRACGWRSAPGRYYNGPTIPTGVTVNASSALGRRIAAIERAKGQHAVVKMRLFARVLCLEGHAEIASEATEALDRLIAVLGDPGDEPDAE